MQILIIEQERLIGLEIQQKLKKNGYCNSKLLSFAALKNTLEKEIPQLIIIDSTAQKEKGFEEVKKLLEKLQLPIICIGTSTYEQATEKCAGVNIIEFLQKPFDSEKLVFATNNYFSKN